MESARSYIEKQVCVPPVPQHFHKGERLEAPEILAVPTVPRVPHKTRFLCIWAEPGERRVIAHCSPPSRSINSASTTYRRAVPPPGRRYFLDLRLLRSVSRLAMAPARSSALMTRLRPYPLAASTNAGLLNRCRRRVPSSSQ